MSGFMDKFRDYRATKMTLFWTCAGTAVLTLIIGFNWFGLTTAGSAADRAEEAASDAVAQLAADICYDRFMDSPSVRQDLTAFNDLSSYSRDSYLEDEGWTTFGAREDPIAGAADLCAERLAEADIPAAEIVPVAENTSTESDSATGSDDEQDTSVN